MSWPRSAAATVSYFALGPVAARREPPGFAASPGPARPPTVQVYGQGPARGASYPGRLFLKFANGAYRQCCRAFFTFGSAVHLFSAFSGVGGLPVFRAEDSEDSATRPSLGLSVLHESCSSAVRSLSRPRPVPARRKCGLWESGAPCERPVTFRVSPRPVSRFLPSREPWRAGTEPRVCDARRVLIVRSATKPRAKTRQVGCVSQWHFPVASSRSYYDGSPPEPAPPLLNAY